MTDQEWLDRAIEFDVGLPPVINGYFMTPDVPDGGYHEHDRIVVRDNAETKVRKWAAVRGSRCLTKKGSWMYESMPSHRTAAFIKRTRFDTRQEAFEALQQVWEKERRQWIRKFGRGRVPTTRAEERTMVDAWKERQRQKTALQSSPDPVK